MSGDGRAGWFAYEPDGSRVKDEGPDPEIHVVELRALEHAGPFWDDEGHLSDDYEELRRWIGITRPLFDDVITWSEDFQRAPRRDAEWRSRHLAKQRELTSRLSTEVHPGITVMVQ